MFPLVQRHFSTSRHPISSISQHLDFPSSSTPQHPNISTSSTSQLLNFFNLLTSQHHNFFTDGSQANDRPKGFHHFQKNFGTKLRLHC
ncbi:unnamed protein product [Nesidiocoris tenuis]|uniref:Uncharacterized protein n=1 Tax=Nesidiocoris tenuis TaxID=355587 RepID=A0A6H5GCF0_9HEMI|nr:unnamed protein product [Nesidiocoris tenuis]